MGFRTVATAQARGLRADIDWDEAAFMASLVRAVARLEVAGEAGLWTVGLHVQNVARALCPVDTGRLRSSIMATRGQDGMGPWVEVGTNVYYAAFVEFGTRYMAAQPYLRPALAQAAGMLPGAIRQAV